MAFNRTRPEIDRFMEKAMPVPEAGCWLWVGAAKPTGYGNFYMRGKHVNAHRASLILHGRDPAGGVILHKCDTPSCVNPDHLSIGTTSDNARDMVAKGRQAIGDRAGEANSHAKLTTAQVALIRESAQPTRSLADSFGVSYGCIRNIRLGLSWKEVA